MDALFGPAGNSEDFYASGYKATVQAPAYLHEKGLTAYEIQFGRGVSMGRETAEKLGENALLHGVALSVHAPYYISLASAEEEKRQNSVRYIVESAQAAHWCGAKRIVVHPGGLGGLSRESACILAKETLAQALNELREKGFDDIILCPETMGKINQLGNLDEVLSFCLLDESMLPCVDFGHLNSRTGGGLKTRDDMRRVLQKIADVLGEDRAKRFHIHFSKIEYSKGGEKRHLTFEDTEFGPDPEMLLDVIVERCAHPVIICESAGTQAADAAQMMEYYRKNRGFGI